MLHKLSWFSLILRLSALPPAREIPLRLLGGRLSPGPLPIPEQAAIAFQISSPQGSRVLADPNTPLTHTEFQLWL